jgi:hypothetical protein
MGTSSGAKTVRRLSQTPHPLPLPQTPSLTVTHRQQQCDRSDLALNDIKAVVAHDYTPSIYYYYDSAPVRHIPVLAYSKVKDSVNWISSPAHSKLRHFVACTRYTMSMRPTVYRQQTTLAGTLDNTIRHAVNLLQDSIEDNMTADRR